MPSTSADRVRRVLAGALLALMVGALFWASWKAYYQELRQPTPPATPSAVPEDSAEGTSSANAPTPNVTQSSAQKRVLEFLRKESAQIGQLTDRPEDAEARLDAFAGATTEPEADVLAERSLDRKVPEDERFLAVEVLARLKLDGNPARLEKIVAAPFADVRDPESARGSIEWLVRARASEGLESFVEASASASQRADALRRLGALVGSTTHPLLQDRLRSALARHANPQLPPTPERDEAALRRVLTPSR